MGFHYCYITSIETHLSVNGMWSGWSDWSGCSVTCGVGNKSRIRLCNNPVPADGGLDCEGDAAEERACILQSCYGR